MAVAIGHILTVNWYAGTCDHNVVIVDIGQQRLFCLIQEDPEIPFTEDDFRRRKPHINFKEHISAEKMVIKYGKTVITVHFSSFCTYLEHICIRHTYIIFISE